MAFSPYYGRFGDIRVDLRKARLALRARPKTVARRPRTALDIAIEKAARRRRWAKATGRTYVPRVQRNAARERRTAAFRRIERVLLDTRQRVQPGHL
jgi:hypothetical protein